MKISNMNSVLLFMGLLTTVNGLPPELIEEVKQKMIKLGVECKGEVEANDDDIAPILTYQIPTTDNGRCFIACMHKKLGLIDQSGKLDKSGFSNILEKIQTVDEDMYQKMKQVGDKCFAEVTYAGNQCDTAVNFLSCLWKECKEMGINPKEGSVFH